MLISVKRKEMDIIPMDREAGRRQQEYQPCNERIFEVTLQIVKYQLKTSKDEGWKKSGVFKYGALFTHKSSAFQWWWNTNKIAGN